MFTRPSVADMARYAALLAAMLISFDTQRHLALSHGISDGASYAVPVAIDLFLVWAVRSRRDVALAVGVAMSANVAGVLSSESLSAVSTWVGAALHAVFPLSVWRMHRAEPETADSDRPAVPQSLPLPSALSACEAAPKSAPAISPEAWLSADLWADFDRTESQRETATPPSPEDVRAVIAELGGHATGQQLARHYGVSDRTGRRYLRLASEVDA